MAYFPIQNQLPNTYGDNMMNIANMFIAAGWTIPWSLNGTNFTPNATPAINPLTAATWTNNNYTGFGVLTPDGVELSFQRGAAGGQQLRYGVSAAAKHRDGLLQFAASATSGYKFSVADGDGVTKTFIMVSGSADVVVNCSAAASAATQIATFLPLANAVCLPAAGGLAGYFYQHPTLTDCVIFKKTNRATYPTIANVTNSPLTSFNPSGTRVPIAYDDGKYHAYTLGTDIAPTFATVMGTNGTYRQNGVCNGSSPYHFAVMTHTNGANTNTFSLALDRRTDMEVGSFSDVALLLSTSNWQGTTPYGGGAAPGLSNETGTVCGWIGGPAVTDAGWGVISAVYHVTYYPSGSSSSVLLPAWCPVDPWTGQDTPILIQYWRRPGSVAGNPGPFGPAGTSTLFWWNSANNRVIGDTSNSKTRWIYGNLSIIGWDGATTLIQ